MISTPSSPLVAHSATRASEPGGKPGAGLSAAAPVPQPGGVRARVLTGEDRRKTFWHRAKFLFVSHRGWGQLSIFQQESHACAGEVDAAAPTSASRLAPRYVGQRQGAGPPQLPAARCRLLGSFSRLCDQPGAVSLRGAAQLQTEL